MRASVIGLAATSILFFVDLSSAQDQGSSDTIVLDEVLIAFYEIAPRRLAASMWRPVAAECARDEATSDPSIGKARPWMCDGNDDTFLRAVDGQGRGMLIGYVCQGAWGSKYYATIVVANAAERAECVAISYGGAESTHMLQLSKAGR
jgi:hypothetical protein